MRSPSSTRHSSYWPTPTRRGISHRSSPPGSIARSSPMSRASRAPAPIRTLEVALDAAAIRQKPEPPFQEERQAVDLSQAERIVAVGRGIKDQDKLPIAQQLAEALRAELA